MMPAQEGERRAKFAIRQPQSTEKTFIDVSGAGGTCR